MASTLVSMKITKAEHKKQRDPSIAIESPAYPYGLSITLDDSALKKLDAAAADYQVGETLVLVANVEVTNISSHDSKGGSVNESVGLQITDMCLEAGASAAADALYEAKG